MLLLSLLRSILNGLMEAMTEFVENNGRFLGDLSSAFHGNDKNIFPTPLKKPFHFIYYQHIILL